MLSSSVRVFICEVSAVCMLLFVWGSKITIFVRRGGGERENDMFVWGFPDDFSGVGEGGGPSARSVVPVALAAAVKCPERCECAPAMSRAGLIVSYSKQEGAGGSGEVHCIAIRYGWVGVVASRVNPLGRERGCCAAENNKN